MNQGALQVLYKYDNLFYARQRVIIIIIIIRNLYSAIMPLGGYRILHRLWRRMEIIRYSDYTPGCVDSKALTTALGTKKLHWTRCEIIGQCQDECRSRISRLSVHCSFGRRRLRCMLPASVAQHSPRLRLSHQHPLAGAASRISRRIYPPKILQKISGYSNALS